MGMGVSGDCLQRCLSGVRMSEEYQKFIASWPVITFVGAVIFSSGILWANVIDQGHKLDDLRTVKERLATIEAKLDWLIEFQRTHAN